jgi:hypothetical protein
MSRVRQEKLAMDRPQREIGMIDRDLRDDIGRQESQ